MPLTNLPRVSIKLQEKWGHNLFIMSWMGLLCIKDFTLVNNKIDE